MALQVLGDWPCMEALLRLFFLIIRFMWEHMVWSGLILLVVGMLNRKGLLISVLAFIANLIGDTLSSTFFGAFLLFGVVFSSLFIGLIWVTLLLNSPMNIFVRIVLAPFFFVFGFIWGIVPLPIPLSIGINYILNQRGVNIIACISMIVLILMVIIIGSSAGFLGWISEYLCMWINEALKWLS